MNKKLEISSGNGTANIAVWCPGNGTKYRVAAMRFKGDLGNLGIADEWGTWCLVIDCSTGRSYLFRSGRGMNDEFVAEHYVQEKLGTREADLKYVTFMVAKLLCRPCKYTEEYLIGFAAGNP